MPAAVAVPLITAGVSAGTGLVGAKMQSGAAKKAGETQARSAAEAMRVQADLARQAMGLQGQMWQGIQGLYNPYTASAPATLSALHEYLGIPGAAQAQTMVPYGGYGPPMRPPFLGQPGAGGPPVPPQFGGGVGPYAASLGGGVPPAPLGGRPMPPPLQQRQFGGPVNPNQPYVVGEQGPEVFVPSQGGNILPNAARTAAAQSATALADRNAQMQAKQAAAAMSGSPQQLTIGALGGPRWTPPAGGVPAPQIYTGSGAWQPMAGLTTAWNAGTYTKGPFGTALEDYATPQEAYLAQRNAYRGHMTRLSDLYRRAGGRF